MATPRYGFPAVGLLLISLGFNAVLYASRIETNLWFLLAFTIAVLGAWTTTYGIAYSGSERSYYCGWGAFLILIASSSATYGFTFNSLYSFALLAIGLGTLILVTVLGRSK